MAKFGGPLIDAGFILSTVLATIRDSDTGSLSLPGIPEANVDDEFYDVRYLKTLTPNFTLQYHQTYD